MDDSMFDDIDDSALLALEMPSSSLSNNNNNNSNAGMIQSSLSTSSGLSSSSSSRLPNMEENNSSVSNFLPPSSSCSATYTSTPSSTSKQHGVILNPYNNNNNNKSTSKSKIVNPYMSNSSSSLKMTSGTTNDSSIDPNKRIKFESSPYSTSSKNAQITSKTTPLSFENEFDQALRRTMEQYFGHTTFRPGQVNVVKALLLHKRDVSVFWATGRGKSLCYQLPALHSNKISIVVSPLISLMQDQCHKLNNSLVSSSSDNNVISYHNDNQSMIATFLGGAQMDASIEDRALVHGEFKIIYVTPEKLLNGSTLSRMAQLHMNKGLCCIAIDEAHCVSEWGHDFRPEYRQLYQLRTNAQFSNLLNDVPIITLTATAVPRVQNDITQQLHLRQPLVDVQSFDRPNLNLCVQRKPTSGGYQKALKPLVDLFETLEKEATAAAAAAAATANKHKGNKPSSSGGNDSSTVPRFPSTIVYVPTKTSVEEIASWLSNQLRDVAPSARVGAYHASQSQSLREDTHTLFLVGNMHIIVATIAFGMGIDKPDIRRVIHYGPPKCLESYMQQIGRAGRDGLTSECCMFCNDADFNRLYNHEIKTDGQFVPNQDSGTISGNIMTSIKSLQQYANDTVSCRRAALLRHLKQDPPFGERCGTCDNCLNFIRHGNDLERDMTAESIVVLTAIFGLKPRQAMSVIEKLLKGTTTSLEKWRFRPNLGGNSSANGSPQQIIQIQIDEAKKALPPRRKRYPASFYRELISLLVERGYLHSDLQKGGGEYKTTWTVYSITPKGIQTLKSHDDSSSTISPQPIFLSIPPSLREIEEEEDKKRKETLSKLEKSGVDLSQVPKEEIEAGDGEVIKAHKFWMNRIEHYRNMGPGKMEFVEELLRLRRNIEQWRSNTAVKYKISPANVMPEHLVAKVAYTASSSKIPIKAEALMAVGVRTAAVHELVQVLKQWSDDVNGTEEEQNNQKQKPQDGSNDVPSSMKHMVFSKGKLFIPTKSWKGAAYRPNKKTGKAAWESSYERFRDGEDPQAIAMAPTNGRPIQVATVVSHVMDGLLLGKAVALDRLAEASSPPTEEEWNTIENIVTSNIDTMNIIDDSTIKMADMLRPIMGDEFMETPYQERDETESVKYRRWCEVCKWFLTLKRAEYGQPTFA